ncbi:LysR family transcriptional regulator [Acinetobacter sp. S40]|uniref:LysR family transcriptional regulator n=1 Tax=unclassified Acinetobacter TaxID=196816 RepID=UPI00190CA3E9|nr:MULTISPECIES: LysR family transcriptional regulator [unclassified Acinetobacter]MBJ9984830.1 LysR family transcriptional regulator [Acinetobacter sp. S40]MBK0063179.1 LysR family transcriptional regulator [Acinetobacter sp. S55]MBK0066403.1 LysR family transcriptional regulator [Acinetobacter sp. S54]
MDRLDCILSFVSVVEQGNFSKAAQYQNLSRDMVAKRIAYLENNLKATLFHRTTRTMRLTPSGETLYKHSKVIISELDWVKYELSYNQQYPAGELKVNAPLSFSHLILKDLFVKFQNQYPEIRINLTLTDHHLDMASGDFDLTLRISEKIDSSYKSRNFLSIDRYFYATPEYLKTYGYPSHIEDLKHHKVLSYSINEQLPKFKFKKDSQDINVEYLPTFICNNGDFLLDLCLAHKGISFLPEFIVQSYVENGQLVRCFLDYSCEPICFHALWPASQQLLPKKVRLFIDFLASQFEDYPK